MGGLHSRSIQRWWFPYTDWLLVGMEFSGTLHPKLALVNTLFREVVLTRFSEQNPYISILLLYCLCLFGLKFIFKLVYQNCGHFVLFAGAWLKLYIHNPSCRQSWEKTIGRASRARKVYICETNFHLYLGTYTSYTLLKHIHITAIYYL